MRGNSEGEEVVSRQEVGQPSPRVTFADLALSHPARRQRASVQRGARAGKRREHLHSAQTITPLASQRQDEHDIIHVDEWRIMNNRTQDHLAHLYALCCSAMLGLCCEGGGELIAFSKLDSPPSAKSLLSPRP